MTKAVVSSNLLPNVGCSFLHKRLQRTWPSPLCPIPTDIALKLLMPKGRNPYAASPIIRPHRKNLELKALRQA